MGTGLCAATLLAGLRVKDFVFEEPIVLKPTLMEAAISDGIVAEAAGRDWFRGQPATNATDPEIADWFRNKPAAAAGSDWFRGHPTTNDTDAEIVDWFRNKPAAAAENDWFRGHPATNDTDAKIVDWFRNKPAAAAGSDWFRGQPATNDTDAEIADWFRGQPAEPAEEIVFGDFSFADDEEILLDVPAGDTGDGKIGKSFNVKDEAMLTAAADAVKFTNSVGNAERQMAVLFKQLDIDGDGLISRAEVKKACKDPKNENVRQMLGLPKKMDVSSLKILNIIFQGMDTDNSKEVNEEEFLRWMRQVKDGEGASYQPTSWKSAEATSKLEAARRPRSSATSQLVDQGLNKSKSIANKSGRDNAKRTPQI